MEIYVKISLIFIFSFFFSGFQSRFCHIHLLTHVAASNTATPHIRSPIAYLKQTYKILMLISYSKLKRNAAALAVLVRFNDDFR